jgi:hypothetical protein
MKPPSLIAISVLLLIGCSLYSEGSPREAGKQLCASCHSRQQQAVIDTPHQQEPGCEGCHGTGKKHVQDPRTPGNIFSYKTASAEDVRQHCAACHRSPVMEHHAVGDVSCITCHSSHHYLRKKYLLKPDDTFPGNN